MMLQGMISRAATDSSSSSDNNSKMAVDKSIYTGDLHGLPGPMRAGMIAMTFLGFLSFVSVTLLLLYISYRLLNWHIFFKTKQKQTQQKQKQKQLSKPTLADNPYTLGLPPLSETQPQPQRIRPSFKSAGRGRRSRSPSPCPSFSGYHHPHEQHDREAETRGHSSSFSSSGSSSNNKKNKKMNDRDSAVSDFSAPSPSPPPAPEVATNPFLLLIYNLLISDMIQSAAFLLSVVWLTSDATDSGSAVCWIQGWLTMTGKLSASACLVFASGLTYLTVVRGYRASPRALYLSIAAVWLFTYVLACAGVGATRNGKARGEQGDGGWYAWTNGWCWVNPKYRDLRFWLGYFWIFVSIGLSIIVYGAIFVAMLRRKKLSWRHMPPDPDADADLEEQHQQSLQGGSGAATTRNIKAPPRPSGHHPAFLIYPIMSVLAMAPLAMGRVLAMAGYHIGAEYFLVAGTLSASHGFINVVIWSTCILCMGTREQEELGLDRFMRTPTERTYGNMVWIQGGGGGGRGRGGGTRKGGGGGNSEVRSQPTTESWKQRLLGRGGGETIWRSQARAKANPWSDGGSEHSCNGLVVPGQSEGGNGKTTEMQILTTVTIETSENSVNQSESLEC